VRYPRRSTSTPSPPFPLCLSGSPAISAEAQTPSAAAPRRVTVFAAAPLLCDALNMQERMECYRSNKLHPLKRSPVISLLQSKKHTDKVVAHCLHYDYLIVMLLRIHN
jgi:hypothetical protein